MRGTAKDGGRPGRSPERWARSALRQASRAASSERLSSNGGTAARGIRRGHRQAGRPATFGLGVN